MVKFRSVGAQLLATGGIGTAAYPAGVVENDLLLMQVGVSTAIADPMITPTGWTKLLGPITSNSGPAKVYLYYRVAGSSEPTSILVSNGGAAALTATISAFSGVDTVTPFDVSATATLATSGTSCIAPTVTTTKKRTMVLRMYWTNSNTTATMTPAAGNAEFYDQYQSWFFFVTEVEGVIQAAAGASGTATAVNSAAISGGVAATIALNPRYGVFTRIDVGNGLTGTDEGSGVVRVDAAAYLLGHSAPASDLGATGDLYENIDNGNIYKKVSLYTLPSFRSQSSVAVNNATSHPCSMPAGVAVGDALVMVVTMGKGSATAVAATTPTGWTLQGQHSPNTVTNLAAYTKIADGTEGATLTLTTAVAQYSAIAIVAYSAAGAFDNVVDYGSVQNVVAPSLASVTPTVCGDMIVGLVAASGLNSSLTSTAPFGWTKRSDQFNGGVNHNSTIVDRPSYDGLPTSPAAVAIAGDAGSDWTWTVAIKGSGSAVSTWVLLSTRDYPPAAHTEFTANVSVSGTTAATATTIVRSGGFIADGSTAYCIEFFAYDVSLAAGTAFAIFALYEGATEIGRIAGCNNGSNGASQTDLPIYARRFITPAAGTHVYTIGCYKGTPAVTVNAGAGASGTDNSPPGYIRITRAS